MLAVSGDYSTRGSNYLIGDEVKTVSDRLRIPVRQLIKRARERATSGAIAAASNAKRIKLQQLCFCEFLTSDHRF